MVYLTLVGHLSLTGGARTGSYLGVFWQFSFFVRPPVGVQDELELHCYLASTERPAGFPLACVAGTLRVPTLADPTPAAPLREPWPQD